MYVKCMLLHIIMHTLHAWFTVVVHYLCTACDQLPPAACVTCLDEYTDAVSIYKINVVYKKIIILIFRKHRLLVLVMLMQ